MAKKPDKKVNLLYLTIEFFKFVKPYKKHIIFAVIILLTVSLADIFIPFVIKIAIDKYISKDNYAGLMRISVILLMLIFYRGIFTYVNTVYTQWIGQNAMKDIRTKLYDKMVSLDMAFFNKTPVGKLVTRITNNVADLNELLTAGIVALIGDFIRFIGIVIILYYINPFLALITYTVIPILALVTYIFSIYARKLYLNLKNRLTDLNIFLQETLSGARVIQIFNREDKVKQDMKEYSQKYYLAAKKSILVNTLYRPGVSFITSLATAVVIYFGSYNIIKSLMTFGGLIAYIQYLKYLFQPIIDFSDKYNVFQSAMSSMDNINEILSEKSSITDPENPIKIENIKGKVSFKNVSFSYKKDSEVIRNVSFELEAGKTTAVVGFTGAGKTTLIGLLLRFYDPQYGKIELDEVDIKKMTKDDLRKPVAVVLQDSFIFSGTIRYNITLGRDYPQDRIDDVVKSVNLDKVIDKFPDGLEHKILEGGATLSEGQKQLISFARALITDPKILILDEATANIDPYTESLIQDAMKKLLLNRTAMIIAHRLSTIRNADKILVLHKGKLIEQGTHDELIRMQGHYHKLYNIAQKIKVI